MKFKGILLATVASLIAAEPAFAQAAASPAGVPMPTAWLYKGLTITLGGFAAFETVWRSRNEESDIGSTFSGIPMFNSPLSHMQEFRETERQSRVAGLVQGNPDATTHLAFYGEFDFLAGPRTANSNESNSFSPRVRHVYGTADWDDLGLHVLAGQTWSLLTLDQVGENPRTELAPPVIDAQYVAGFTWTRQPQFRVWKDWNKVLFAGISIENPQATFNTGPNALPAGLHLTNTSAAGGQFDANNSFSINHIPDIIGKVALDPDPAHNVHLEAWAMYRDFYDRANYGNHDSSGTSVGMGAFLRLIPGMIDFQGTAAYGMGLGRYGTSQLPDATIDPNTGIIKPLMENAELAGLTWHATGFLDVYGFAGREQENARSINYISGGVTTPYGYGNPLYVNSGCYSETAAGACVANTKEVDQLAFGVWDNFYRGAFGNLRVGLQYSYTNRKTFTGVGGAPSVDENMFFTSFRFYPF